MHRFTTWKTVSLKPEDKAKPALWKILSAMNARDKESFFHVFSQNTHVSFETIFALSSEPWNFTFLSYNRFLTWENVQAFPSKEWNYFTLLSNENISLETIFNAFDHPGDNAHLKKYANKWERMKSGDADEIHLMQHFIYRTDMTWEFIQAHPEIPWNYSRITWCCFITQEIIENNPHLPWDKSSFKDPIFQMVKNPHCSVKVQERLITKTEFRNRTDLFPFVDIDFIKKHPEVDWNWNRVVLSPNITWNVVMSNPEYPWPMDEMCSNKYKEASFDFIFSHLHLPWNFVEICRCHKDLTWDIVASHMHVPWCFTTLSAHPCINMTIVRENRHISWNFYMLSSNPSITWEDVWENRHENWCLKSLAYFTRDPCYTNITPAQLNYVLK